MYVTLIITFLLILLVSIFGFQNGVPVEVNFLFWHVRTSLITVIFGSSLIGALIIAILTVPKLISKHFKTKKLSKELNRVTLNKEPVSGPTESTNKGSENINAS